MTRGRLIFPFHAELFPFDAEATTADPDGAGPLTSGMDPDFRESVVNGTTPIRREHPPIRVPCQVEPEAFEALSMAAAGNSPRTSVTLVFHFATLEELGLVDENTGTPTIRVNDRLTGLYDRDERCVLSVANPPGLFVTEVRPSGFGLGGRRNLCVVFLDSRSQAARAVAP